MSTDGFVPTRAVGEDGLVGTLFEGLGPEPRYGVLVLHGSGGGGGYERDYARLLARHGFTAFCVDYFGVPGRPDALDRISLSYFERAIEWLAARPEVDSGRVGVVGFSRGGEAALLTGAHFDHVGAVVSYVGSGYAFPAPTWMSGVETEGPAWTLDGEPIPYIPVDAVVESEQSGIDDAIVEDLDASTSAVANATEAQRARATIPVERIDGPVLFVSGGADAIWPSSDLVTVAIERLDEHDHPWAYEHLAYPRAGHAIRTPYRFDERDDPSREHRLGGTNGANAYAAADAWPGVLEHLRRGLER